MPNLSRILSWFNDRRKIIAPVSVERRVPRRMREAEDALRSSIDRLHEAATKKLNGVKFVASNDKQAQVIFETFRDVCAFSVGIGAYRICRHPRHEAANTGQAPCAEEDCPFLKGAA